MGPAFRTVLSVSVDAEFGGSLAGLWHFSGKEYDHSCLNLARAHGSCWSWEKL